MRAMIAGTRRAGREVFVVTTQLGVDVNEDLHTPLKINGWNLRMKVWKMIVLFKRVIFRVFPVSCH